MIILGVLLLIIGVALCGQGYSMNNDMNMQMESLFSEGVTNPGDTYLYVGIILAIAGIILIIAGLVKDGENKNQYRSPVVASALNEPNPPKPENETIENNISQKTCRNCGAEIIEKAKFCSNCGTKVMSDICDNCGNEFREKDNFCSNCGSKRE